MTRTDADGGTETSRAPSEDSGRKPLEQKAGASSVTVEPTPRPEAETGLLEMILSRENMMEALRRVEANKGAPGVDGLAVGHLRAHLVAHWVAIKEELLAGRYEPAPVRGVEIPKPGGGLAARSYVAGGRRWLVDIDQEKFFDRVNHDVLMARVARRVGDKRVLRLIRRYLQAGLMTGGLATARSEGTPQGGPLSPLLSNILLDDLDRELERRGHAFCRYADDCNIYVRSERAGQRVMASLTRFLTERLRLTVNLAKSAVDRPWKRTFLGFTVTAHREPRLKVAPKSVVRLRDKLREQFRIGRGQSVARTIEALTPVLRGWIGYFRLAQVKGVFEELDGWIRRKLRAILWRQWKRPSTRARQLMQRGIDKARAWLSATNGRGPWWNAGASHMNDAFRKTFFDQLGLKSLLEMRRRLNQTA